MINILDNIYSRIPQKTILLRLVKYIIRVFANLVIPMGWIFLKKREVDANAIIVSLTSYPERIKTLHKTILSLLLQDQTNIRIILWLSKDQISSTETLPQKLLKMQNYGLEIRFVDGDLRSHKKYFYAFSQFPDHLIVTVDDDVLYPSNLISTLLMSHERFPDCVICNRGNKIMPHGVMYKDWPAISCCLQPQKNILPTGIGGILYPPRCYDKHIFDIAAFKENAFYGDDLWINFMCRVKGTRIAYTGRKFGLITVLFSQDSALMHDNVAKHRNDMQIKNISCWSMKKFNFDFFVGVENYGGPKKLYHVRISK